MTAAPRFGRRMFLTHAGRGVVAIAVVGIAACAPDGQATSPRSSSVPVPRTLPPPRPPEAIQRAPAWQRVDFCGGVYAYVLARGTEAAVVDTGTPCGDGTGGVDTILVALETAGLSWANVGHVIMTHSHGDHTGNVAAILEVAPDAEGYAGAEDVPRVGKGAGATPVILPRPLIPVVDGDEVFGLRIVATPGHTPGHIAVLDEALGVLVMGDALTTNEGRPTAPPIISTGDLAEALRSVAKVASLDFETLLVGHGEPIESGASRLVREFVEACSLERILDPAESACRYPLYGP